MYSARPISGRHDFVLFFDVSNGNPNGDPDAANLPRLDPETSHGLVSDVALKRKVRNYVAIARTDMPGYGIYMQEGAALNATHLRARLAVTPDAMQSEDLKRPPRDAEKAQAVTRWMCANFWDIRAFGAVMSTGVNAGQVRGPVQLTFARSVEPIVPLEIAITRLAATTERDAEEKGGRTMGRKAIIPYALYRAHGFVSAHLADHPVKGTGFSALDLDLFFEALCGMFEHDRSAARGEMATRRLVVFRHATALGNAPAHALFERVTVCRSHRGEHLPIGDARLAQVPPARSFADYHIAIEQAGVPASVEIHERG